MLEGVLCHLRAYRGDDAARLAQIANDPEVARWASQRFPHPYTLGDARDWLERASVEAPVNSFAIVVAGELAGGVGIRPLAGEERGVALFGYWLGRDYWGQGIATDACRTLVEHALGARGFRRLEANVFVPNTASMRVLEKCGFIREGILRSAVVDRDGVAYDSMTYGLLRSDGRPAPKTKS